MAFSPYSALKDQLAAWLDWTGRAELTVMLPEFVTVAEGHMNGDGRLKVREAETILDLFPVNGVATLPTGLASLKLVASVSSPTRAMSQITASAGMHRYSTLTTTADPVEYAIAGNEIYTYPSGSSDIRIVYYPRLGLVSDTDTNWLLQKYPGAYLYGALAQAAVYLHDPERLQTWSGLYEDLLNKIAANDSSRYAGSIGTMRGPNP